MTFDTNQATVFQIRRRHLNKEVRELIPADYAGVIVTDCGKSYDAEKLLGVKQRNVWITSRRTSMRCWSTKLDARAGLG